MTRRELEHVIRAAGAIAEVTELIVLCSQAILGKYPDAPGDVLLSEEVDTYPAACPERADLIDGSIGELSPFHEQFGYYAHGVGPETATRTARSASGEGGRGPEAVLSSVVGFSPRQRFRFGAFAGLPPRRRHRLDSPAGPPTSRGRRRPVPTGSSVPSFTRTPAPRPG